MKRRFQCKNLKCFSYLQLKESGLQLCWLPRYRPFIRTPNDGVVASYCFSRNTVLLLFFFFFLWTRFLEAQKSQPYAVFTKMQGLFQVSSEIERFFKSRPKFASMSGSSPMLCYSYGGHKCRYLSIQSSQKLETFTKHHDLRIVLIFSNIFGSRPWFAHELTQANHLG